MQALVEKHFLYILGQSSCSDVEHLSYMPTRIQDLDTLKTQEGSIQYAVRFFSGDGPVRQFEAGYQRGGNYSCLCGIRAKDHFNLECAFRSRFPTLEDRMKTFRGGQLWKRCSLTSPFTNMRKPTLVKELQFRGHSNSQVQN